MKIKSSIMYRESPREAKLVDRKRNSGEQWAKTTGELRLVRKWIKSENGWIAIEIADLKKWREKEPYLLGIGFRENRRQWERERERKREHEDLENFAPLAVK